MKNSAARPAKMPTFKYGSSSYYVLAFSYIYDKAMSIDDYVEVANGSLPDRSKIQRALGVLEKNSSVIKITEKHWRITVVGVQQLLFLNQTAKV